MKTRTPLALCACTALLGVIALSSARADRPLTARDRIAGQVIFNTSRLRSDAGEVADKDVRRYLDATEDDEEKTLSFDDAVDEAGTGGGKVRIEWDLKITFLSPARVAVMDNDVISEKEKEQHQGQDAETEAQVFYEEKPRAKTPAGRVYFRLIRDDVLVSMRVNRPLGEGAKTAVANARPRWAFFFAEAERLGLFLPRDDYPRWIVRAKKWQQEIADATAGTWPMIAQLSAAARSEKLRGERILEAAKALEKRDDPAAARIHTSLLAKAREAGERVRNNIKLMQDIIRLADEGWAALEDELSKRLEREDNDQDHKDELEPWLRRVKQDRTGNRLELSALASQDNASRDRLLEQLDEASKNATDENELLRLVHARITLGAHRSALHAARELLARFPRSVGGEQVRAKLEVHFLEQIVLKLRQERPEVDRLLAEWGGGQIDPATGDWKLSGVVTVFNQETGEWQLPEVHIPWMRWMGLVTGETYRLWSAGQTEKAKAAEQLLGLHLLIHLRHHGFALSDIPLDGKDILQSLDPRDVPSARDEQAARATRVEKAVFAALDNPDVKLLVAGKTPLIELRGSYLQLSTFQSPEWDDLDGAVGELVFNQIISPGLLGFGGKLVMKVPLAQDVLKIFMERGAGKFLVGKPAEYVMRYREGIASLSGYRGLLAQGAQRIGEPWVIGHLSHMAGEAARHWDNDGYTPMAVSMLVSGWISAIDARAAQLSFKKHFDGAAAMTQRADQRRHDLERAGQRNDALHDDVDDLARKLRSQDPKVVADARQAAKRQFHKLRKELEEEVKLFSGDRRGQPILTSFDEKQRLKAALGQMAKPDMSPEQLRRELTAARTFRAVRGVETRAARQQADMMERLMGIPARPQPASKLLDGFPKPKTAKPAPLTTVTPTADNLRDTPSSLDNNTLVNAFEGDGAAKKLIQGKERFVTPEVYNEFINPKNTTSFADDVRRFKRLRWFNKQGIEVKPAVVSREVYDRVAGELGTDKGASDLRQITFALERGHRLITNEGKYVNILVDKIDQGKLPYVDVVRVTDKGDVIQYKP